MKTVFKIIVGFCLFFLTSTATSCKTEEPKDIDAPKVEKPEKEPEVPELKEEIAQIPEENRAFTWVGTIKKTIPVFIHFTEKDSVLSGQITYLNTKEKKPIRIIGEIQPNNYRILEFDKKGLITGIMSLKKNEDGMSGTWYASGNENSFEMKIEPSDSILEKEDLSAEPDKVFGQYIYRYTKDEGNFGDFSIKQSAENEVLFEILGVHSAPGYNIASIEEVKVPFPAGSTVLDFNIPDEESCDFDVAFYADFAIVRYVNGYCQMGYFGHNATVEGIFLKVK